MIIKKLYRKTKCRWWDKERKVFQNVTTTDYIGWFLFGIIPIYLIELGKYEKLDFVGHADETVLEYGIYKDYGYLVRNK